MQILLYLDKVKSWQIPGITHVGHVSSSPFCSNIATYESFYCNLYFIDVINIFCLVMSWLLSELIGADVIISSVKLSEEPPEAYSCRDLTI